VSGSRLKSLCVGLIHWSHGPIQLDSIRVLEGEDRDFWNGDVPTSGKTIYIFFVWYLDFLYYVKRLCFLLLFCSGGN
jgi:hypothetical protein